MTRYCNGSITDIDGQPTGCDKISNLLQLPSNQLIDSVSSVVKLGNSRFLAVVKVITSEGDTAYKMATWSHHFSGLSVAESEVYEKTSPSPPGALFESEDSNYVYACFETICGRYEIPDFKPNFKPLQPSPAVDHTLIFTLVGCPTRPCFDGNFDAAFTVYDENGDLLIYYIRGIHVFEANGIGPDATITRPMPLKKFGGIDRNVDAAIVYDDQLLAFDNDHLFQWVPFGSDRLATRYLISSTFSTPSPTPVDAAFTIGLTRFALIKDNEFEVYRQNSTDLSKPTFDRVDGGDTLPLLLQVAAAINYESTVYFMGDNFFQTGSQDDHNITVSRDVQLVQGQLFKCDDSEYSTGSGIHTRWLNITKLESFQRWRGQFFPGGRLPEPTMSTPDQGTSPNSDIDTTPPKLDTETEIPDSSTPTVPRSAQGNKLSRNGLIAIIVGVLLVFVVLVAVVITVVVVKRNRRKLAARERLKKKYSTSGLEPSI